MQATTVIEQALGVLTTAGARDKARRSIEAGRLIIDEVQEFGRPETPPDRPARPEQPELMLPGKMPRRRHAGTLANKIALLHAIAHIELNAIDLAWDLMARFGHDQPRQFWLDWAQVGSDEGRHFLLLDDHLRRMGSHYGAMPAHDGLWQAACDTDDSLLARLAIIPMVLEARGLDVTPQMIERLRRNGDSESCAILEVIYNDEINHVRAGVTWFRHTAESVGLDPVKTFHKLVRERFKSGLKEPFNRSARAQAGMIEAFFQPLAPNS